jgi:hypothetical protein
MEARRLASKEGEEPLPYPPVFIVGAPRTGSTFLYQLLTCGGHFFYLNNYIIHRYQVALQAANSYYRKHGIFKHDSFESDLGATDGPHAPHEGGYFWYRWFQEGVHEVDAGVLNKAQQQEIKAYLRGFEQEFERPILFKNLNCGLRLRAFQEFLDQALFIHIGRDSLATARSIYRGRLQQGHSADYWLSLKPQNWEELHQLPVEEQIVRQIETVNHTIIKDSALFGSRSRLYLRYEDLLAQPENTLMQIEDFLVSHHLPVHGLHDLRGRRKKLGSQSLDAEMDKKLLRSIEQRIELGAGPEELYLFEPKP